jgi:putative transposase
MYANRQEHSIIRMAGCLNVSESGYYKWLKKKEDWLLTKREEENIQLTEEIRSLFFKYRGIFGVRKITNLINKNRKEQVNHKRVERLMREQGLRSRTKKKYVSTTNSNHQEPIAEDLLKRDFTAKGPKEKLVSDTTYIQTEEGTFYAAVILDLYGRMPLGLHMSLNNDRFLVIGALKDMITRNIGPKSFSDCICHSDQGSTYASKDYRELLEQHGLICSMCRVGDPWDNAPMESFFGKMKTEWLDIRYKTIEHAAREVLEYTWDFYPKLRPHQSNNYLTPMEYYYLNKTV